jgi:high-affinity iron transporter
MRRLWVLLFLCLGLTLVGRAPAVLASAGDDVTGANQFIGEALQAAKQGDITAAKAGYDQFRKRWLEIEDGIKEQSKTAYKDIEGKMGDVQFALLQTPPDQGKLQGALQGLSDATQKFVAGGYPADGGKAEAAPSGSVKDLLAVLDEAKEKAESGDAAGAAKAMDRFRQSWLEVEGIVLTQSGKVYGDAERDMVDAYALLSANPPDLQRGLTTINNMREYLAPLASKTTYGIFDAMTILLREGLEALLVVVALLGFLKKAGHPDKGGWVWGGVGAGLGVSMLLAGAVKLLFGTGAFGSNNFLIAGWTGIFAAVMLVWVSYWLHSKSSITEWNRYIREQSNRALATGNLFSLAFLSFLAVFREGTETVLFYVGMATSISTRDLVLGLVFGTAILAVLALVILKVGLKVPLRPFFVVSSILVFYLGFKFTGMGIHGLQLAGLLPATVVSYLPHVDFLALYPNWQSTLPQAALLLAAVGFVIWSRHRDRSAVSEPLKAQNG